MDNGKSAKTADQLLDLIIAQNMQPGDKLPNEYGLMELLGVGRSTLREAVKALVSRNVLEVRQGAGTFVASTRPGVAEDPLGLTFIQDKEKLTMDLLEIRLLLEPRIAALAATHATDQQVSQMQQICRDIEAQIHADENHMEKDVELHELIAQSSQNLVVPNLLPIIQQAIGLFIDATDRKLRAETIDTHKAIVEAIAARDPVAAEDAMTLHLIYNRSNLKIQFGK